MVDKLSVENPANVSMHYGNYPNVGLIDAPDSLPRQVIFSSADLLKLFNNSQRDSFERAKSLKPKKSGLPDIIKIALGAFALWIGYSILKQPAVNLFKKVFRH